MKTKLMKAVDKSALNPNSSRRQDTVIQLLFLYSYWTKDHLKLTGFYSMNIPVHISPFAVTYVATQ